MAERVKSQFEKDIETQKKLCNDNVATWKYKLAEAQQQLIYWEMQADAMRAISTRLMLDGWKTDTDNKVKKET